MASQLCLSCRVDRGATGRKDSRVRLTHLLGSARSLHNLRFSLQRETILAIPPTATGVFIEICACKEDTRKDVCGEPCDLGPLVSLSASEVCPCK